jgi:hypothetical protein
MRRALSLLPLLFLFACKTSPEEMTMEELYQASIRDLSSDSGLGGLSPKVQKREEKRIEAARHAWLEQRVKSAGDHLWCAAVLYGSDASEDLELARKLALRAVELGEPRGLPLSAEIGDKELLARGLPQRYGTQVVFDDFLRRYRMWDLDPGTTDAERRAVGLPSLEELLGRVEELDRGLGRELRGDPEALPESDQDGD